MMQTSGEIIFTILSDLRKAKISYSLAETREEAITIFAAVPGQRWEIDIFKNGDVDFEVFKSNGEIFGLEQLNEQIQLFSD